MGEGTFEEEGEAGGGGIGGGSVVEIGGDLLGLLGGEEREGGRISIHNTGGKRALLLPSLPPSFPPYLSQRVHRLSQPLIRRKDIQNLLDGVGGGEDLGGLGLAALGLEGGR